LNQHNGDEATQNYLNTPM